MEMFLTSGEMFPLVRETFPEGKELIPMHTGKNSPNTPKKPGRPNKGTSRKH